MGNAVPLQVLILEDDPADAELMVDELQQAEFDLAWQRVETEADYLAALTPDLDVILADHKLPQFDGYTALALLQERGWDIPFIVVSGSMGEELAVSAMKRGAADYLMKDRLARLGEAVKQAIRQKKLRAEKNQAEEAVRAGEKRFRALIEHSTEAIILVNAEGTVIYESPGVTHILGYPVGERASQDAFERVHPEELQDAIDMFSRLSHIASQTRRIQFRLRHQDGSWRWVDASATNLLSEPEIGAIVVNYHDITEQREAQEERLRAERLRVELEKEKELVEWKGRFTSMVSHEFRTPLTTVMMSTTLLEQHYEDMVVEKRLKYFQGIKDQVKFMVELLDDVLNFSKAQAGKLEFNPKPVEIEAFCKEIFEQLQATDVGAHEFIFSSDCQWSQANLDTRLLRHVLVNLLSNAAKYSPTGRQVRFELSSEETYLVFRISDQGIGIPPADQERLFEPFYRARNASDIRGTGLGLAIVKSSVEAHGGAISFESRPGEGTSFTVHVPI